MKRCDLDRTRRADDAHLLEVAARRSRQVVVAGMYTMNVHSALTAQAEGTRTTILKSGGTYRDGGGADADEAVGGAEWDRLEA
jgi:hypothetical protein